MKFKSFLLLLVIVILVCCQPKRAEIDYFGQTPPGSMPKVFAPGIICLDDRFEAKGCFSPDGKAFYFTITNNDFTSQKIFYTEFNDGRWSKQDTASFSKKYNNLEPFIDYSGKKLYFSSDRTKDTLRNKKDLFVVEKHEGKWSEPKKLKINSDYSELVYNQSKKGTIYFTSNRPGGIGQWDIYFAKSNNGKHDKVENIGSPINQYYSADPCIAPDESYLIFNAGRIDGYGASDLYISFNVDNKWTEPQNMGHLINTEANEYGPFLSPDNKYLFFVRHDGAKGDIYWVDINVINELRPQKSKDWYLVEKLDDKTYIISEPKSTQGNSCFLIMGDKEAILFDSGTGENKKKSMTQVFESLTKLPVTLLLSHFHFDHIGNVGEFSSIGIPEIEQLKNRLSADNQLKLNNKDILTEETKTLKISKQYAVGKEIDLGNRKIKIIHTPGHSKESISIIDIENKYVFTGDLVYNGLLLINDSDAYIHSIDKILNNTDSSYKVFGSHSKPAVKYERLAKVKKAIESHRAGNCSKETVHQINLFGTKKNLYKIDKVAFIDGYTDAFIKE